MPPSLALGWISQKARARLGLILLLLCCSSLLASTPTPHPVVSFDPPLTVNEFPRQLSFHTTARSQGAPITEAWLLFYPRDEMTTPVVERVQLEVQAGEIVGLSYTWETEDRLVVPGMPIVYWWEVEDSLGRRARSDEHTLRYEDTRFNWQVYETEALSLWLHDQPESLGEYAFTLAQEALQAQSELYGTSLRFPIRILLYNSFQEFAEYHARVSENVGGEAYTGFGITAQILPSESYRQSWLPQVIPHEISHLYFRQLTFHPACQEPPSWLNEGLSVYNEQADQSHMMQIALTVAADGRLRPLTALSGSFGPYDPEGFYQAYAESYSAVVFLLETYGAQALADLIQAYGQGLSTDKAFKAALGMDLGAFQNAWAEWLGAAQPFAPTPTALVWPTPGLPPTRTPTSVAAQPTPTPKAPPLPSTPDKDEPQFASGIRLPCLAGAIPVAMIATGAYGLGKRRLHYPRRRD